MYNIVDRVANIDGIAAFLANIYDINGIFAINCNAIDIFVEISDIIDELGLL